ncbi:MAG: helix-turn-helix transcriptional regulator [Candidatus Shapirobacteria bacterium]
MSQKNNSYSFKKDLANRLKNPEFRQAWEDSEPEFNLTCQLIEARLAQKLSQRDLAQIAHTTQAVISRLETMSFNPSLALLQKIATALNKKLTITLS